MMPIVRKGPVVTKQLECLKTHVYCWKPIDGIIPDKRFIKVHVQKKRILNKPSN